MNAIMHIRKDLFGAGQAEFAALVGVSQPTVSRWEKGSVTPRAKRISRILELAAQRGVKIKKALVSSIGEAV